MEPERNVTDNDIGLSYRLYGVAPVQAEGTVGSKPFYFRVRHKEWTFAVALTAEVNPVDIEGGQQGFYCEGRHGKHEEARRLVLFNQMRQNLQSYLFELER